MKKIICTLILCLCLFGTKAFAIEVVDVTNSYYAAGAIANAINKGYMTLDGNKFHPNATISRAEFVHSLLIAIQRENIENTGYTSFSDVNSKTKFDDSILSSEQLRLIVGYPDKTFKPEQPITRAEANSVLANVTKGFFGDIEVLNQFSDKNSIPNWALYSYAKNVHNDIAINKEGEPLRPNEYLTRADAAIAYLKIEKKPAIVQEQYKEPQAPSVAPSEFITTNTLKMVEDAPRDVVNVYNTKCVVEAGNIILVSPAQKINSKKLKMRDQLVFVAKEDAFTQEGTFLYPAGTQFIADVQGEKLTPIRHKKQKNLIVFRTISMPNGISHEMAGVAYTTDRGKIVKLKETINDPVKEDYFEGRKTITKANSLIKYTDKLAPMVKYNLDENDTVYVLLTGDMVIPNESYWEFEVQDEI